MKQKFYKHLLRVSFLLFFAVGIGNTGWAVTDYYWVGGASGTINDGTKWAASTGGLPIGGGTITFANDYSESLHFDGNSGASVITVNLNGSYYFDHIIMASNQKITLDATSSQTIEILGVHGGTTLSEFVIGTNVYVMDYGHIDGGDNTKTMNRVTIYGTLEAAEWVNADYFAVNTGALFRTSYVSTGEGWWYGLIATPGNNITAEGQIEYMGNGQAVVNISYYDLLFSGDPGGAANVLKGTNLHVTHKIEIYAPFNLSTNGILYFKGTTFINNTTFTSLTGTISNSDVAIYTEKTYSGTGSIQIGTFSNSSSQRVDVKFPISANNVIFDGTSNIDNSYGSTFTVGIGSTDCSITLDGVGSKNVGTFSVAPTFGSGLLTLNYNKESSARTTGYEMPSSFAYLVIKNDKGVVLASDETITGSVNVFYTSPAAGMRGRFDLNGKVLHYTGTGTFINGGTLLGTTGSTISFENSSTQTLSLSNSTSTLIDILKVDNTGLTVSASSSKAITVNNVYFNHSGGITRSSATMTVGSGGSTSSIIEFNNLHGGSCSNFVTTAPTFNIGSGGLTVNYKTESASRTIGFEMPSPTTNTAANIYVSNTHGVTNSRDIQLTGDLSIATGAQYDLSTFLTNRSASGGTLLVNGKMRLGGSSGGETGSNFPLNYTTKTMTGGTVEYYGGTQTVYNGATYNNLITTTTGTKSLSGNLPNITGDLTINSPSTFDLATYTSNRSTSGGTLLVDGTMKLGAGTGGQTGSNFPINFGTVTLSSNSTVEYNGSDAVSQTIYATPTYNILNLSRGSGTGSAAKTITANLANKDLNISSGASFTVPINLTVTGTGTTTTNADTKSLIIKSTSAGAGSLIASDLVGSGTVERFVFQSIWHLVSPPAIENLYNGSEGFLNRNLAIPYWSLTTTNLGIASYDYASNSWRPYLTRDVTDTTMVSGQGYLVRTERYIVDGGGTHDYGEPVLNFQGTLKGGSQTVTVKRTGSKGWNCIGNPFTSAISLTDGVKGGNPDNFLDVNDAKIDATYFGVYILNEASSDAAHPKYDVVNYASGQTYASLGQGFFVEKAATDPEIPTTLSFTKAMQIHQPESGTPFKSGTTSWPSIKLTAAFGPAQVSTDIKFIEGTTTGLDKGYDAGLFRTDAADVLYTRLVDDAGIGFQLQCLPANLYNTLIIPVGIESKAGGEVTFSADAYNLDAGCNVILEDRLTARFTDLTRGTYKTLILPNTVSSNRFFLHTADIMSGIGDQSLSGSLNAYAFNNSEIRIIGEVGSNATANLYDVLGRLVVSHILGDVNYNVISIPAVKKGVYLLNIVTKDSTKTIKVMVRN